MTRPVARTICACIFTLTVSACTQVPELEDKLNRDLRAADYPDLIPLDQVLAPLPLPENQSTELEQQLQARSAQLQNRAQALNAVSN